MEIKKLTREQAKELAKLRVHTIMDNIMDSEFKNITDVEIIETLVDIDEELGNEPIAYLIKE